MSETPAPPDTTEIGQGDVAPLSAIMRGVAPEGHSYPPVAESPVVEERGVPAGPASLVACPNCGMPNHLQQRLGENNAVLPGGYIICGCNGVYQIIEAPTE